MNENNRWYSRWAIFVPPEGDVELIRLAEINSVDPNRALTDAASALQAKRFFPNGTVYFYAIPTPSHEDAYRLADPADLLPTDKVYTDVIEIKPYSIKTNRLLKIR